MPQKALGEILMEMGLITQSQLEIALREQEIMEGSGRKLGEVLIRMGFIKEFELVNALSIQTGLSIISAKDIDLSTVKTLVGEIDDKKLIEKRVIPFMKDKQNIHVALTDPSLGVQILVEKFYFRKGMKPVFYIISPTEAANILYSISGIFLIEEKLNEHLERAIAYESEGGASNIAIPALVDALLTSAIVRQASDMHIVYDTMVTRIFLRIDGVYRYDRAMPGSLYPKIAAMIKQRAGMDVANRLVPQDGHMIQVVDGKDINIRVSYIPLVDRGESIVLRILDEGRIILSLDRLGFYEDDLKFIVDVLSSPHGLVLVTGPTGSGKTTTLYSIISYLSGFRYSILTIEDPVEYRLPFVRQVQVNRNTNLTPDNIIRSFLRHDPDVIMVGEVRDKETAETAVQAAETGHLVLATLHTNDAPSSLIRLYDMGVSKVFLASAIRFAISQRIVRKVCSFCAEEMKVPDKIRKEDDLPANAKVLKIGKGCKECSGAGYRGVTIVYECYPFYLIPYELLKEDFSPGYLAHIGQEYGYKPMKYIARRKLMDGIISFEDYLKYR